MRSRRFSLVICVASLVAAACTGDDGSTGTTTIPETPTTEGRVDDGLLLIGVVAPSTGAGGEIGNAVSLAVRYAVEEITAAGGVEGHRIRIVERSEGDNLASTVRVVQELIQLGVDAVIGPTSALRLLGALGHAVDAGVLTCAPTASAISLDAYPDGGLLVRTMPSDSLEAMAMAQLVDESGNASTVVVYLDDGYGRPFADAVQAALTAQGTTVTQAVGFTADQERLDEAVTEVTGRRPALVVVIADAATGPVIINAIDDASASPRPNYVVNDAVRRPSDDGPLIAGFLATRIEGVSPLAVSNDEGFVAGLRSIDEGASLLFAHNAYDCMNLIALGAQATSSGDPAVIAAGIPAVSGGGTTCLTFPECAEALGDGRNVDYDGPSGEMSIGPDGDMASAVFERFGFDESGRDVGLGILTMG